MPTSMADREAGDPPSPFVSARVADVIIPRGAALDVAMGRGRHALLLARRGFRVFGVDRRFDAVSEAMSRAKLERLRLAGWCADLRMVPLPPGRFDLIVIARYLERDLFGSLAASLKRGGVLLYETFTTSQRRHGRGPTSAAHLLEPGELRRAFPDLDEIFYEEVDEPEAVARLAARRR